MVWKSETCIYPKVLSVHLKRGCIFAKKSQNKTVTVYNGERLNQACLKSNYNAVDEEAWLRLWQHCKIVTRIMTDNILPGHIRILRTPQNS